MEDISHKKRCTQMTTEQDVEDVLRLPSFAEFCHYADHSDSQSSHRSSVPDPIRTSLSQDDSSSSIDTPVFGDPRSPFAASSEEVVRLCDHFRHIPQGKAPTLFAEEDTTEACSRSGDDVEAAHHQYSVFGSPSPTSQVESGLQYDQAYYGQPSSCHPPPWSGPPYSHGSHFPNVHPFSYQELHRPVPCSPAPRLVVSPPFPPPYPYLSYAPAPPFQTVAICQQCGSSHWMASSTGEVLCSQCRTPHTPQLRSTFKNNNNAYWTNTSKDKTFRSVSDFKNRKGHGCSISDVLRIAVDLSKDRSGSKFLQREIPLSSHEELEALWVEILPESLAISSDVFGNFVIQKLLEFGTSRVITELVAAVKPNTIRLSLQKYSCRVIQKSIEVLPCEFKADLAVQLDGYVELCSKDEYANHVVQRCIQHLKTEHIHFIYEALLLNIESFAVHHYGRRVVQKAVERSNGDFRVRGLVLGIVDRAVKFAYDPNANLIVQHLLRQGPSEIVNVLVDKLMPHMRELNAKKYSRKVVETCLAVCNHQAKQRIRNLIFDKRNLDVLDTLGRDPYGHFTVDLVMESCSDDEKFKIRGTAMRGKESNKNEARQRQRFERIGRLSNLL